MIDNILNYLLEIVTWVIDNLPALLFWGLATVTAACAIAVVASQNIVRSATWLLFSLGGASGIFFLLGADFVGATQLLVYVGGTLVLVIFGVMLTAQGPFISMQTSAAEWGISAIAGSLLVAVLILSIFAPVKPTPLSTSAKYAPKQTLMMQVRDATNKGDDGAKNSQYADAIGLGFMGVGVGPAHKDPNPEQKAEKGIEEAAPASKIVRTNYLLPFEIVSVHLLVVLIGAAYLARAKRRRRVGA